MIALNVLLVISFALLEVGYLLILNNFLCIPGTDNYFAGEMSQLTIAILYEPLDILYEILFILNEFDLSL